MFQRFSPLPSEKEAFLAAREAVLRKTRARDSIGTMGEKTLHAVLKRYYEPDSSRHEIPVGEYVADIVGEQGITEIQTRQFSRLQSKLCAFLEAADVTVVYPIVVSKRVISTDAATGELISSRLSPKKGGLFTAVPEIYVIRRFLHHPRLTLRLPLLAAEEHRVFGVKTRRRKKQRTRRGEFISDLIPTELLGEIILRNPQDYGVFFSRCGEGLPDVFSAAQFAASAGIDIDTARRTLALLAFMGQAEPSGRQGSAKLYRRVGTAVIGSGSDTDKKIERQG